MDKFLKYKIAVTLIPRIGPILAKKLIAFTGSVEGIFFEKKRNLIKIPGIGEYLATEIANQEVIGRAEEEISFIEKFGIKPYFFLDEEYPARLTHCEDSPVIFFSKGEINFNHQKIVAIVGTRSATSYGKEQTKKLVSEIAERGHDAIIVSGLAFGIDITAHRAALDHGLKTIAILAHGLDIIYPAQHRNTARDIVSQGALLTEFLSKSYFDRPNFVKRNRIIAGLSDATIVVESSEKGGSLLTADLANSYNRDVFAFPGKATDRCSKGSNHLIKTNKAHLIESADDLEYIMGWDSKKKKGEKQLTISALQMSEDETKIYHFLKDEGDSNIDFISMKTGIPVHSLSALLLNLEFNGLVKTHPGKMYSVD